MNAEKRRRLFIGLACPAGDQVTSLLADLATLAGQTPGLRPVPAENLHITLRFLGMVRETEIAMISQALAKAVVAAPGLTLQLRGIGGFANAVWLGVEPRLELAGLARRINQCLEQIGLPADARPFVPHVTVARLRPGIRLRISSLQARYGDRDWCRCRADTVSLYESVTLPAGARYHILYSAPLAGDAGVE